MLKNRDHIYLFILVLIVLKLAVDWLWPISDEIKWLPVSLQGAYILIVTGILFCVTIRDYIYSSNSNRKIYQLALVFLTLI